MSQFGARPGPGGKRRGFSKETEAFLRGETPAATAHEPSSRDENSSASPGQRPFCPARFSTNRPVRTAEPLTSNDTHPRAPEPWTGRGVPRGRDNDAEKARLQRRMELHGKETLPPPRRLSEMARDGRELEPTPPRRKTRVQEMEEMFSAIVGEIEEREEFLAEMRELGRAERYEREIAAEVAERVNQLKGLDEALRSASGLS